jgi:hypothetical protein
LKTHNNYKIPPLSASISKAEFIMSIIHLLYLQSLIYEKLHKENNCPRKFVGHIALSKKLQLLQTEDDLETLALNETRSESFSEPQGRGAETPGICDYDADISEKFAALTLNDFGHA